MRRLLCSALLAAAAAGIPRRTRRICRGGVAAVEWTRLSGGGGTANTTTYDAAAVAALEERVAASTPQNPYAGFAETTALLADGCGDVAALAARLEPTYRLHVAVLRARAAKAFADALDANDSPERIAEQAVEAFFGKFGHEYIRQTQRHIRVLTCVVNHLFRWQVGHGFLVLAFLPNQIGDGDALVA